MKYLTDFIVTEKHCYGDSYVVLTLQHPDIMPSVAAGQFVEVQVPDCNGVMLRRPISIHDVDTQHNTLTLLIQVVGKGTRKLAAIDIGDRLNLIYPLGHGFSLSGRRPLLVGGGAGIAPLLLLAKCYQAIGVTPTILLGGRTETLVPRYQNFAHLGNLLLATDDGSLGEKGMVTQHSHFGDDYDHICTCGPTPMMKAVARHALDRHIPCELSLENLMACGLGACLCCVVKSEQGHLCVCKEGPVFPAENLVSWINS
mgnify:CR=1 FL=1